MLLQFTKDELLYDLVNGYIYVTADADGNMEYTTTRNHDPVFQSDLDIPLRSPAPGNLIQINHEAQSVIY